MLQTHGSGFSPWLLLLSCPLRFHQASKSPLLMLLATPPPPPPHMHRHPTGSVFTREWRMTEKVIGVLSFLPLWPYQQIKNDKLIFSLALSFELWASLPQGKRNSLVYFRVLNRDVSRPQDKVPPLRSLFGSQTYWEELFRMAETGAGLKGGTRSVAGVCVPPPLQGLRWQLLEGLWRLDTTHSCSKGLCGGLCGWPLGSGGRSRAPRSLSMGLPGPPWLVEKASTCGAEGAVGTNQDTPAFLGLESLGDSDRETQESRYWTLHQPWRGRNLKPSLVWFQRNLERWHSLHLGVVEQHLPASHISLYNVTYRTAPWNERDVLSRASLTPSLPNLPLLEILSHLNSMYTLVYNMRILI